MTDLIQAQSLRWLTQQLTAKKRFFAYIAPHQHPPASRLISSAYFRYQPAPRGTRLYLARRDMLW